MSNLSITERRKDTILILDLDGKIRLGEDCSIFRKGLRLLVENGEKKILLNLANVSYIDSSGLGELVASHIMLQKSGGEIKLVNLSSNIYELMVMTKLLTIFEVYNNENEAISAFTVPSVKSTYVGNVK